MIVWGIWVVDPVHVETTIGGRAQIETGREVGGGDGDDEVVTGGDVVAGTIEVEPVAIRSRVGIGLGRFFLSAIPHRRFRLMSKREKKISNKEGGT